MKTVLIDPRVRLNTQFWRGQRDHSAAWRRIIVIGFSTSSCCLLQQRARQFEKRGVGRDDMTASTCAARPPPKQTRARCILRQPCGPRPRHVVKGRHSTLPAAAVRINTTVSLPSAPVPNTATLRGICHIGRYRGRHPFASKRNGWPDPLDPAGESVYTDSAKTIVWAERPHACANYGEVASAEGGGLLNGYTGNTDRGVRFPPFRLFFNLQLAISVVDSLEKLLLPFAS